jgi:hypothetical protein
MDAELTGDRATPSPHDNSAGSGRATRRIRPSASSELVKESIFLRCARPRGGWGGFGASIWPRAGTGEEERWRWRGRRRALADARAASDQMESVSERPVRPRGASTSRSTPGSPPSTWGSMLAEAHAV